MNPEYKFKQIYNTKSNRLQNYDYSSNWWYFITICTKNRESYFGEIINWKIVLNEYWEIVKKYYFEIPRHFSNVLIDEFIIMPNHVHFIIFCIDVICRDVAMLHLYVDSNKNFSNEYYSKISPKKWELWTIIRSYKSICTREINKLNKQFFAWQPNYYDRIIRNDDELNRIIKYIIYNPLKWELDKNNTENIFM
jgi:REP element-mobilizing transposase RayT